MRTSASGVPSGAATTPVSVLVCPKLAASEPFSGFRAFWRTRGRLHRLEFACPRRGRWRPRRGATRSGAEISPGRSSPTSEGKFAFRPFAAADVPADASMSNRRQGRGCDSGPICRWRHRQQCSEPSSKPSLADTVACDRFSLGVVDESDHGRRRTQLDGCIAGGGRDDAPPRQGRFPAHGRRSRIVPCPTSAKSRTGLGHQHGPSVRLRD